MKRLIFLARIWDGPSIQPGEYDPWDGYDPGPSPAEWSEIAQDLREELENGRGESEF